MAASLDSVPVPDGEVDRLLLGFKVRRLIPFIKGRVLDVGCGSGLISEILVKKNFSVEGVDGSPERIKEARLRVPSARFTCSTFEDYSGPKVQPDTILLCNVLEHVDDPVELLQRCFGWLGSDGCVVAAVPNHLALHKRVGRAMGLSDGLTDEDRRLGHVRVYDKSKLFLDLWAANFDIQFFGGVCIKPLPNAKLVKLDNWRGVLEGYFVVSENPKSANLCSMIYAVGVKKK